MSSQNFSPLGEMQLDCHAYFLSSIKTSGTQTALHLKTHKIIFGVRLRLDIKMNSGATVQQLVSTACKNECLILCKIILCKLLLSIIGFLRKVHKTQALKRCSFAIFYVITPKLRHYNVNGFKCNLLILTLQQAKTKKSSLNMQSVDTLTNWLMIRELYIKSEAPI